MKICVFMSDNRKLSTDCETADYNSLSAVINYEYCKKHNYDFIYYRPYLYNENEITLNNCIDTNTKLFRHPSWSKILSTKLAFKLNYDYVVYIDSDCIFKNFNHPLENVIDSSGNDIIFINDRPWNVDKPNGGFYICRVCPESLLFLDDWFNYNLPFNNMNHAWEQCALWEIYVNYDIFLLDILATIEEEGQFLRHLTAGSKHICSSYLKNFIEINKIDFKKNILEIRCINYDTSENIF